VFQPATKAQAKARIAVAGPAGSGKTMWSLQWATVLADGGKIAVIDTERSSASLYADQFSFDVLQMSPPYHPDRLVEAIQSAESAGYQVIIVDSLTHFWSGSGGVLEIVEQASSKFKGNSFAAWQVGTPIQQRMVDKLISSSAHVICTMRSKTEYVTESDNGRMAPKKVGLAPQQRQDIEYEFTLVLDIDVQKHSAVVSKTRFGQFTDKVFGVHESVASAEQFMSWLNSGSKVISRNEADSISLRIRNLEGEQKEMITAHWKDLGLPKVASLNAEQIKIVEGLLAEAESLPKL
jgi:hypothetical protein